MRFFPAVILAIFLMVSASLTMAAVNDGAQPAAAAPSQSQLPQHLVPQKTYPKIVLYSVSWCPHCKEAKEYFTKNNIPFINRDVEIDEEAYKLLTEKYTKPGTPPGVPVIVIGDDADIIRGFDQEKFEKVLEKYKK